MVVLHFSYEWCCARLRRLDRIRRIAIPVLNGHNRGRGYQSTGCADTRTGTNTEVWRCSMHVHGHPRLTRARCLMSKAVTAFPPTRQASDKRKSADEARADLTTTVRHRKHAEQGGQQFIPLMEPGADDSVANHGVLSALTSDKSSHPINNRFPSLWPAHHARHRSP